MKRLLIATLLSLSLAAAALAETRVYFNPPLPGDIPVSQYIVQALNGAQAQVQVQQYQLTEPSIIAALIRARKRGVRVQALFDKSVGQAANTLRAAGITVLYDPVHIAHNKVLIIDGKLVIGGSFNLTKNANRKNCENAIFLDDPLVIRRFILNFKQRLQAAQDRD